MATTITINVSNNSPDVQNFFFFQQPAQYSGGAQVYTNSLFTAPLLPKKTSGGVLSFEMILQYYAGVEEQKAQPVIGQPSGRLAASQAIDLTPAPGGKQTANTTTMTVVPSLGLSVPVSTVGPQAGSFRIITPTYNPALKAYNAGSAVQTLQGGITLSNFVTARPTTNQDCQPVITFYVQTGTYTPGTVMNFTQSSINAAICDATPGYTTFDVSYNADGTWTVKNFALLAGPDGQKTLVEQPGGSAGGMIPPPAQSPAEVMNEAGTASLSTGTALNPNLLPVTINNLTNPGLIHQYSEYQVGPTGGPYQGAMCTTLNGATGTFA